MCYESAIICAKPLITRKNFKLLLFNAVIIKYLYLVIKDNYLLDINDFNNNYKSRLTTEED